MITSPYAEEELEVIAQRARDRELPLELVRIGSSREDRSVLGVEAGSGPLKISIVAGAHADEPAGPMAAMQLLLFFVYGQSGPDWLETATWRIIPHINPDGAHRNERWFTDPPNFLRYALSSVRESPGDDLEFNYPGQGEDDPEPRPESAAAAAFLADGGPYHLHLSLHGMAFAEGAWWLIESSWADRTADLRRQLASLFLHAGLGYHDIDRRGEKGFHRIQRGFSTTPTSVAMREFFLDRGETDTARLFLPSSMEYVRSLGGDPLAMVSEVPLFRIGVGEPVSDPPDDNTPYQRFRPRYDEARAALLQGDERPLRQLEKDFRVTPVEWGTQARVLRDAILLSAHFVSQLHAEPAREPTPT